MSDSENLLEAPPPGISAEQRQDAGDGAPSGDIKPLVSWARDRWVPIAGVLLIAIQLVWKAQDLRHLYFFQDDYVDLDKAIESPFNWHYLTLIGDGHLYPALRAVTWVLARISPYNWGFDTTFLIVLLGFACLAALRLLRTLFGDRPEILIPLTVYLLTPLTIPDLGWWWCGMESVPFQLAIFMTLNAHVLYVRTGAARHLVAAGVWLTVGLLFFEKAIVLPLLLFAVTAGFLVGTGSWLGDAVNTLRKHWRIWLTYAAQIVAYLALFLEASASQRTHLYRPSSARAALTFVWLLARKTLLTGALGGPWRWYPVGNRLYAIALPSPTAVWLAALAAVIIVGVSIWARARAWQAWVILAGWVVLADMVPVLLGRLEGGFAVIFGLQTRYLADAACVLAVCMGLAFLPVSGVGHEASATSGKRLRQLGAGPLRPYVTAALIGAFALSSFQSVRAYERVTSGAVVPATYMANAEQSVKTAARGTYVTNGLVSAWMVSPAFGRYEYQSHVIGDIDRGRLRWISRPDGTIDGLHVFGANGRLYPALIIGDSSVHRKQRGFRACWPERSGQIEVWFKRPTSLSDHTLELSYIWGSGAGSILVDYNGSELPLAVRHGLHAAYLPVPAAAGVLSFTVSGMGSSRMCVGNAAVGHLVPF